jgi:hypothetical protein
MLPFFNVVDLPVISSLFVKKGFGVNCTTLASTLGLGTKIVAGTLYTSFTLHKLCAITANLPRFDVDTSAAIRYKQSLGCNLTNYTS